LQFKALDVRQRRARMRADKIHDADCFTKAGKTCAKTLKKATDALSKTQEKISALKKSRAKDLRLSVHDSASQQ
jgi:hypothetical protein